MNRKNGTFTCYTDVHGLPDNVIKAILEDRNGKLWLSTNKGICLFDPTSASFKNYTIADGLQGDEFSIGAALQTKDGTMYFAGTNGFNIFHPETIRPNSFIPPVVFTDFQLFNKSVRAGEEGSPLLNSIQETKEIILKHDQSMFSFEFAALNFSSPEQNQYSYKLEGFDKEWNMIGSKRFATYTNIPPGEYTLRVKASNNDGLWNNEGASVKLSVTPPFWMTWWFVTLVVLSIVGAAFSFYLYRVNALKRQKAHLEQQVQERTLKIAKQAESLQNMTEELQAQS